MSEYGDYKNYLARLKNDVFDELQGAHDALLFDQPNNWSSDKDRQWHYEYGFKTAKKLMEKDKTKEGV